VVLAANGPVFSPGHNFGDMHGASLDEARELFEICTEMMDTVQADPPAGGRQGARAGHRRGLPARRHLRPRRGGRERRLRDPRRQGRLFCHTPLVAVARNIGRKRALEMALTGDPIDAHTAADWGLVNRVVPDDELDDAVDDLVRRATRGSAMSKALGKRGFYAQVDLDQPEGVRLRDRADGLGGMTDDAQEGIAAFLEKRHPSFTQRDAT
jgi:hypothetical protein